MPAVVTVLRGAIKTIAATSNRSWAGRTPFRTTKTKAVELPRAALSPAYRRQAAVEGAGLEFAEK